MKTRPSISECKSITKFQRYLVPSLLGLCGLLVIGSMTAGRNKGLVVHEWGTFTSLQGPDGVPLQWHPLETSLLPKFVYDWGNPGLNRRTISPLMLGKGGMVTLQRMETPVIYFYSEREETVDVSVNFPQGLITEWYPQATQIGPSTTPAPPLVAKLDQYAHKTGINPSFTFASLLGTRDIKESRIRWANVRVLPAKANVQEANSLSFDPSGSHYYAARDTDADFLRVSSLVPTNPSPEHEKFIFYRGAGNFATPLVVGMPSESFITLSNSSPEKLAHLFVLEVNAGQGRLAALANLPAGKETSMSLDTKAPLRDLQTISQDIRARMVEALVSEGLYRREAIAMVNTWRDSWFEEDGCRVIYLLPRTWTDRTLPIILDPKPRELVRVMVGRAEIISPSQQQRLAGALAKAQKGDATAKEEASRELKKLGRFAEPALRLATRSSSPEVFQTGWTLLWASARSATPITPL